MSKLSSADLDRIFSLHTEKNKSPLIKAHIIQIFAESPINVWCDYHADANNKDPMTDFQQLMFSEGKRHHKFVNETLFSSAANLPFATETEGFAQVLELMNDEAVGILDMPLICKNLKISGRPDIMRKVSDQPSIFGSHSYEIIEIKSKKNIKTSHVLQAAIYNRMIGKIQEFTPPVFYLINGDLEEFPYYAEEYDEQLDEIIQQLINVINGESIAPTLRGARWPWESYVNDLAIAANDASLIPGIKSRRREYLADAGFTTVNEIAEASKEDLEDIQGIGNKTAEKMIACAKALDSQSIFFKQPLPELPKHGTEVFIDLEGSNLYPSKSGSAMVNYLIGAVVRTNNSAEEFISFFADTPDQEPDNTKEFFKWASSLEDPVFYHWHNYEKTQLQLMGESFEINDISLQFVIERLIDLSPIVLKSYAFPIYKEGLKEIAQYLGFSWTLDDVDAMASIALFTNFVESEGKDLESKSKILTYNEDDCQATKFIFDWLNSELVT